MDIEKTIMRIKLLSLTADVKTPNGIRHFHNGYEFVEIGGIKWATMNIGATRVTDGGLYFQWGDTQGYTAEQVGSGEGQKFFSENNCIHYNDGRYTKYSAIDGKTVLKAVDDAARANWGDSWRMPTKEEYDALGIAVNTKWTLVGGVYGMLCTDKTDSSKTLFFPACGYAKLDGIDEVGCLGCYWSSSLDADFDGGRASYYRYFDRNAVKLDDYHCIRFYGFSVRGVIDC